jgi:hypothetical protein
LNQSEKVRLPIPAAADQTDPFSGLGELFGVREAGKSERCGALCQEITAIHDGKDAGKRPSNKGLF